MFGIKYKDEMNIRRIAQTSNKIQEETLKEDLELDNVDNVADMDKPVSVPQGEANTADRARANHTGTQPASTISDLSYTHNQNTPATVWTVNHNLGKYPSPTVVDSAGTAVEGALVLNSLNQLTFTFSVAFSGKVYCN